MLRDLFPRKAAALPAAPETLHRLAERHGVLRASLYLYREERFFLSAVQDFNEYLEPVELAAEVDDAALGEALVERLRAFDPASPTDCGGMRDWRVLQVSKARSARAFNAQALFVHVATRNSALEFRACPRDATDDALYAGGELGLHATPAEIGATIRKLLRAVRALRAGGLF